MSVFFPQNRKSRRAMWIRGWIGLALIAGGILFMTISFGDSARRKAADKKSVSISAGQNPAAPSNQPDREK